MNYVPRRLLENTRLRLGRCLVYCYKLESINYFKTSVKYDRYLKGRHKKFEQYILDNYAFYNNNSVCISYISLCSNILYLEIVLNVCVCLFFRKLVIAFMLLIPKMPYSLVVRFHRIINYWPQVIIYYKTT